MLKSWHTQTPTRPAHPTLCLRGTCQRGTRSYPSITLASERLIFSIKSQPYFETVATGTSQYQTRVWLPRVLPELGKPKRKGMSSPLSTGLRSSGRGLRKWQEVHFPFIFFSFEFFHSRVDENQLVERITEQSKHPRGDIVASTPASLWSSTFSNTPTKLIQMGGAP